jgi:hypothetical protein
MEQRGWRSKKKKKQKPEKSLAEKFAFKTGENKPYAKVQVSKLSQLNPN